MSELNKFGDTLPSIINNPFEKNRIVGISVTSMESSFTEGVWHHFGSVKFKNGNTEGKQEFKGESFNDIVGQIKSMLDSFGNTES